MDHRSSLCAEVNYKFIQCACCNTERKCSLFLNQVMLDLSVSNAGCCVVLHCEAGVVVVVLLSDMIN